MKRKKLVLKTNLELLHFSLNRADLKPERLIYNFSFEYLLTDYDKKGDSDGYINIISNPRTNKDGTVHKADKDVIRLDSKYITNDTKLVFAGLIELIYQIRNMVIHGHVKPEKEEHEVVKYSYLVLSELMGI